MELIKSFLLIAFYFLFVFIGFYLAKKRLKNTDRSQKRRAKYQSILVYSIIISIGIKFGSNQEVIKNLTNIGVVSLILAISIVTFATLGTYLYILLRGKYDS